MCRPPPCQSYCGAIDRTEYGLTWQQSLASGGPLVGEEVALRLDISAVRA